MTIVTFDPGLRECGLAEFDGPTLVDCAMPVSSCKKERGVVAWNAMADVAVPWILERKPTVLVYEMMQPYTGNSEAKNSQLLQLTGVLGAVGAQLPGIKFVSYLPRQWKGQVPKDKHHRRLTGATSKRTGRFRPGILTAEELAVFDEARRGVAAGKQHNILDAIGIGCYHVGRGPQWR